MVEVRGKLTLIPKGDMECPELAFPQPAVGIIVGKTIPHPKLGVKVEVDHSVVVLIEVVVEVGFHIKPLVVAVTYNRQQREHIGDVLTDGENKVRPVKQGDGTLIVCHIPDDQLVIGEEF